MHLLQTRAGAVADGSEAVDLGQSPGDIVVLSAADTEIASLAHARGRITEPFPTVRLANFMALAHPMSVDLYADRIVAHARLVVVRLLGGRSYWDYGVERVAAVARTHGVPVAFLPGDEQPDPELAALSTLQAPDCHQLWRYLIHGGPDNALEFLRAAAALIGEDHAALAPRELPRAGLYWPGQDAPGVDDLARHWQPGAPVAAVVFYRALLQAANLAPIDALIERLAAHGLNALPIYCASLKDPLSAEVVTHLLARTNAGVVLNTTGFAVGSPGRARAPTPFDATGCVVLQVVLSGSPADAWRTQTRGLSARDIAMNVALPEVDGRLTTRAISFKAEAAFDQLTECAVVRYAPEPDRVEFVARLAAAWIALARTPAPERRIALILANYPNRDGRLGNGVGLDTPAGTVNVLHALAGAGYAVANIPADGDALVARIQAGPTNAGTDGRTIGDTFACEDYERAFAQLPAAVRDAITTRWGAPEADPCFLGDRGAFALPVVRCGSVLLGLQPARGYNIDPTESYHDPALVPPHGYVAFYLWLREQVGAHAIVHMGKHGNLEWLPGKAVALAAECYPEAVLGPLPHIYPFIVNDPGEGTQAKRRSQAVIIDHLTPPLTRAESYGPLAELERLVDEYYEAAGVDPRRLVLLRREILELAAREGLDRDCGVTAGESDDDALGKLDNYLCELKELQIRDGLHIFGESPEGDQLHDLLVALTRLPRGPDTGATASLTRALARDLVLRDFDPLDCAMGAPWDGPRPAALRELVPHYGQSIAGAGAAQPGNMRPTTGRPGNGTRGEIAPDADHGGNPDHGGDSPTSGTPWRTYGDTVERLEALARGLIDASVICAENWPATAAVLDAIDTEIRPAVDACGRAELDALLTALDGRFVEPGPSGAPTRGRADVLPTGRNFYSVDSRVVPTPAAWQLGWKSAGLLLDRYRQDHGEWPRQMALSAWGTSNMRTGGDDIAQALALMGVRPTWETSSRRVTGFEILPPDLLGRPRVDVTLRVSGFFRDAFPAQMDLFDSAARAVAALDEDAVTNPLRAQVMADRGWLVASGVTDAEAERRAGFRLFGSRPGAYGAGLQALIDERGWHEAADLARAYVAWGGYAYSAGRGGEAEHGLFERRLGHVQAVVHNQDNREHDLLDSDDYYQFEGGLAAAVEHASGNRPVVYHNDHSRPESPKIRLLEEEIARVVRARVVNPKWIAGVMRHGYKGAFEMAATVDYLFAFAATAGAVANHHFDAVYAAFLDDPNVHEFLQTHNRAAQSEMAVRFLEAMDRDLWQPRSNSARARLEQLATGA